MRYPAPEKLEIIRTVEASHLPVKRTLAMIGIPSSTYCQWYARWVEGGLDALADRSPQPKSVWNRIPDEIREGVVEFALDHEDLTARELAVKYTDEKHYFVSESSAYRILKAADLITAPAHVVIRAADEFRDKTTRPNELWQTDFTYLKVIGWGWFYLITILDDYSRYIVASHHPQTQGKIERWHQTMKNRILLENYYLPGKLERQIEAFVDYYNNRRYHESLGNLTPADVYHGRGAQILSMREEIKKQTIRKRRLQHQSAAA